jgi:hypothetical protein
MTDAGDRLAPDWKTFLYVLGENSHKIQWAPFMSGYTQIKHFTIFFGQNGTNHQFEEGSKSKMYE